MRKIVISLVAGAAALSTPALAEDKPPESAQQVQVRRTQGGSVRAMNKTDKKSLKINPAQTDKGAEVGKGGDKASQRAAPKKI